MRLPLLTGKNDISMSKDDILEDQYIDGQLSPQHYLPHFCRTLISDTVIKGPLCEDHTIADESID